MPIGGRSGGIALERNGIGETELEALRAAGGSGGAWNATHHGVPFYAESCRVCAADGYSGFELV